MPLSLIVYTLQNTIDSIVYLQLKIYWHTLTTNESSLFAHNGFGVSTIRSIVLTDAWFYKSKLINYYVLFSICIYSI